MNKKFKYTSLVAAGAVTLGLVGGTLAWFTAQHEVVNEFSTPGTYNPDTPQAGIEIIEDWNDEHGQNITPGTDVNKDVQVKNTENYNQFIRVKLTPQFVRVNEDGTRTPYTEDELKDLEISNDMIELKFTNHLVKSLVDAKEGDWVQVGDHYYYIGKVSGGSHTNTLLDSVTLSSEAKNQYRGLAFDVVVTADSIQASNGAYADWADKSLHAKYETLEGATKATEPVDVLEGKGVTTNDGHNH